MPSELPVQVSGYRGSLCSHQGRGFPRAWTKLQRAEMEVINGHSCCWLIPAMDFPTSPSVTPTCFLHSMAQHRAHRELPEGGTGLRSGAAGHGETIPWQRPPSSKLSVFKSSWSIPVETPSWSSQESCNLLRKSPGSFSSQPALSWG